MTFLTPFMPMKASYTFAQIRKRAPRKLTKLAKRRNQPIIKSENLSPRFIESVRTCRGSSSL